jgi:hypothetical protein
MELIRFGEVLIMKCMVLLFLMLISIRSEASEYCYDRAVRAVSVAREELLGCQGDLDVSEFDRLSERLASKQPVQAVYSQKIINSLASLYRVYRSDLPYGDQTRNNECIQQKLTHFDSLRLRILDALVYCR